MVDNQVMSAFVKDYAFDNLSRIGEDGCSLGQRGIQNVGASNYMLQNFFSDDCTMKRPIEFATSQPNINFTGGHQVGAGGCNIDLQTGAPARQWIVEWRWRPLAISPEPRIQWH